MADRCDQGCLCTVASEIAGNVRNEVGKKGLRVVLSKSGIVVLLQARGMPTDDEAVKITIEEITKSLGFNPIVG